MQGRMIIIRSCQCLLLNLCLTTFIRCNSVQEKLVLSYCRRYAGMAMNVMIEAKLNHVVEVLPAPVPVDIAAPDVSFPGKGYLAVDRSFLAIFVLFAVDDTVKAMRPSLLALLCHEELGDFDIGWLLFPFPWQIIPFLFHKIIFIVFMLTYCNYTALLLNLFTE